jgi:RimJ/RimL family protein N-acetyltransferase
MEKGWIDTMNVTLDDVIVSQDYVDWLNDPEVTHYLEGNFGDWSIWKLQAYVDQAHKDSIFKGIYADGVYVGNIKAGPVKWRHKHADIGIMIGNTEYWGLGIGKRAISLMVEECKARGLHCLTAGIIAGNKRSMRAFVVSGFHYIGAFPEFRALDDDLVDELFFVQVV